MNLRNWSKYHTIGLLVGLVFPRTIYRIIELLDPVLDLHLYFYLYTVKAKIISLACIPNLVWFHIYLKRKNYDFAMGIILATFVYLFVIIYYKFLI